MFKKILSFGLVCTLMLTVGTVAFAAENEENAISVSYNAEITNGIVQSTSAMNSITDKEAAPQNITLSLNQEEDGTYTATGKLKTNTGLYNYTVGGNLESVLTQGGEGVIGFMSGELENGEHLGMNLHYIPETNEIFIYATIGYVTDNGDCETYIFGDTFEDMNALTEAYAERQGSEEVYSEVASEAYGNELMPLAAGDYNVTYRGIGIQQGQLINGNKVDLIATTFYTPKRMGANEIAKGYVKVNGHTGNARMYIQGTKAVPGALSVWASSGTCTISSPKDNYMEMSNMDPGDESWSVELPIPYYVGGKWGLLPWNINIGIDTIKTSLSKNAGSTLYNNTAKWKHNYTGDVNWDSDGAAATKKGYAGCCSMSYQYNRSSDYTTSVTGSGTIDYNYLSQYGATQYTGNFSAASSVSVNITIDKR